MKKVLILSFVALSAASCGNRNGQRRAEAADNRPGQYVADIREDHNAENSLDYAGTYEGTVPCADCPGIKIELKLDRDDKYTKKMQYIDRDSVYDSRGAYSWDASGNRITLIDSRGSREYYKAGENQLTMLDMDGNAITGEHASNYILRKR